MVSRLSGNAGWRVKQWQASVVLNAPGCAAMGTEVAARIAEALRAAKADAANIRVHMAGLEEWVFPGLEEENDKLKPEVPASKDLLQLLGAAVTALFAWIGLIAVAGASVAGAVVAFVQRRRGRAGGVNVMLATAALTLSAARLRRGVRPVAA